MDFGDSRLPPRFWAKLMIVSSGCWLWHGATTKGGYGHFSWQGKMVYVHLSGRQGAAGTAESTRQWCTWRCGMGIAASMT